MANMSTGLVSPRYRHFIPVAPSFSVLVPGLKQAGVSGGLKQIRVCSMLQEEEDQHIYHLEESFEDSQTSMINMYVDGVFIANNYGFYGQTAPVLDELGNPTYDPISHVPIVIIIQEYQRFNYIEETNAVNLTSRMTIPPVGAIIRFETIVGPAITENVVIPMKKYLIQGTKPADETIINDRDPTAQHFQGGYRCVLEVISKPKHGVLKISDDHMNFEYRPEVGFYGEDCFYYRLVNSMGQESPVAVIKLKVGSVKPTTK